MEERVETEIKFNETKGNRLKVFCSECNLDSNHEVLQSVDTSGDYIAEFEGQSWSNNYQIIQCLGCDSITFRHEGWHSESEIPECPGSGISESLFPERSERLLKYKHFSSIPHPIYTTYKETLTAFNNRSFVLCAAGLRAIVEGICSVSGVKSGFIEELDSKGKIQKKRSRNLIGKISGLSEKGLLTKEQSNYLHEFRFLGNDALHKLSTPSYTSLKIAIELIEIIIGNLYELPGKAAKLSGIRTKKRKK